MPSDQYRINSQTDIYYMTFTVIDWMDVFTRPAYKNVIVDSLNHCVRHKGLEVYAWCLMTNHMHIIMRAMGDTRMSDILRDFKGYIAKQILALMEQPGESRGKQILNQMAFGANRYRALPSISFGTIPTTPWPFIAMSL